MRKLKLQMQISIDGFIAGPNGELDWTIRTWDAEIKKYVYNLTRPVDCIVLGKNLANNFIDTWAVRANDQSQSDSFARKINETYKVVFSKTLENKTWGNTRIVRGNIVEEINNLKNQKGRDIIVYGGASFVSSLIKENLIDEYNLLINPVVLGSGISIFHGNNRSNMELVYSNSFDCGITAICYIEMKNKEKTSVKLSSNSLADNH